MDTLCNTLSTIGDIAILVNNVGILNVEKFSKFTKEQLIEQINVNNVSPTIAQRLVLNSMLQREKKSAIINIGSMGGDVAIDMMQ